MSDHTVDCRGHLHHRQVVADPQPEYKGPDYIGLDDPVQVDAKLHTLLQVLWAKGFQTQYSCQGWPYHSEGAKRYTTRGYILFAHVDQAMNFFGKTYRMAADRGYLAPKLILETSVAINEDFQQDSTLPPRGTIRFDHADLTQLEELWTV